MTVKSGVIGVVDWWTYQWAEINGGDGDGGGGVGERVERTRFVAWGEMKGIIMALV